MTVLGRRGLLPRGEVAPPYRRGVRGGPGRADRGVPLAEPSEPDAGPAPDAAAGAHAAGAHAADDVAPPAGPGDGALPARRRTRLLLGLAAVVLALDVASKALIVATIAPGDSIRLLGGALYLTDLRNSGAAFSFAQGKTILFTIIAVVVVVVIVRTARRLRSAAWATALGLVLGGALGNLLDRIFRAPGFLRGAVVDFLSLFSSDGHVWPVFNVADSAIVCGGILGAILAVRGIEFDGSRHRDQAEDGAARR